MPSEFTEDVLSIEKQPTGRTLNRAIDALMKDGVKSTCDLTELQAQLDFILYILECQKNDDVRLSFDEMKALWGMIKCLQDAIRQQDRQQEEAVTVHIATAHNGAFEVTNSAPIGS